MSTARTPYLCLRCQTRSFLLPDSSHQRLFQSSAKSPSRGTRLSTVPKAIIDLKHIRQNPDLYKQNCLDRNYKAQSGHAARINGLFKQWQGYQIDGRVLRERSNILKRRLANTGTSMEDKNQDDSQIGSIPREDIIAEAREIKDQLSSIESMEKELSSEIDLLASSIPNLTSDVTPRGHNPTILGYLHKHPHTNPSASSHVWRSHVQIGSELSLLDFTASATSTGWGWYYLTNEAALLEQALVQYALSVAMARGWRIVSPPSIVYSHIASACGFQPRDQNDEQQSYTLAQSASDVARGKPELSLAATAEIPLAAMQANVTMDNESLPMKRIAVSRCYRAEAGARGVDTKGLYRVHEFTKVEMFGWSSPDYQASEAIFDDMVAIQKDILKSLDLHCRILEMPSTDLGASAIRKVDIEAFFPSRLTKDEGWGEVTSASMCTDYQSRRLGTRVRVSNHGEKMEWPWTVNGTAMAVPRVLAAILENGWVESGKYVTIPKVLRPWMGGKDKIEIKEKL